MLQESQPELQQYFLQLGYDVLFVDVNLNYDFDPFVDPYMFQCIMKEIEECYRSSDGVFMLALVGNKYGSVAVPLELGKMEFDSIRNTAKSLNLGNNDAFLLTIL